ncbi:fused response regulator/thioredoxin-disulfide reductase [Reticulibacter mediterranei]|uniref:Fused response regulator/thioredoxin-disulfide reductase n=1 Tax=Reticulibacter mediterranei TaxID=2778369 RepID=A0A8J3IRZ9_9CHLR|nr:FAD-dependent oxidoreductase [Reticulibacter mediterranei]GHO99701.1 fused response regulator/thioredoxin-disulfide reductase [Reticulibacter mediterranei]
MAKPAILLVDDDPGVLHAIDRDVRRRYGSDYRILRAGSGAEALEVLKHIRLRNEAVALLLTDQRMPQMDGVTLLERAKEFYPDAKRVLLTAYADTDVAIQAINSVRLDYYLVKPWNPPEEQLYPVLQDLLDDWRSDFRPLFEGVRVIGHRWSPQTHQIKDFLTRNLIPYQWLDIEASAEAGRLLEQADLADKSLPIVLLQDATVLVQPTIAQLAEKVGLQTHAGQPFYDLVIVGAGPAGLAAAVYGASEGLRTVLIEREAPGGQAGTSSRIENYLGFPVGLSGADLTRRAVAQARRFGVEVLAPQEVVGLRAEGAYRFLKLGDGSELRSYALVVATGVSYRTLNVPGVERLTGAGIYYGAAMTEAMSCQDTDVFIVGGANSAGQAAMYFSRYARTVTMLVRADSLSKSMSQYLIDEIGRTENITVYTHTEVQEARGEMSLQSLTLKNSQTGETQTVPATALFIFIGAMPCTEWLGNAVQRDKQGFVLTGSDLYVDGKPGQGWTLPRPPFLLETSMPGVFAAGDVRLGSIKRVASGVGEGSIAIQFVHRYLAEVR